MRPLKFKECNAEIAKGQDEYNTLHAHRIGDRNDTIVTCWGLSPWERIKLLFTGRVWMSEWNFYRDVTPRYLSTKKKEVI